jgi:hypothetical protein
MVVCVSCGGRNEADAEFCGSCGEYLEWSGAPQAVEQPVAQPAARAAATPPAGRTAATAQSRPGAVPPAAPASTPVEVKPGEEVRRRPTSTTPRRDRPVAPGEIPCGRCGAGNDKVRHFCRRCGAPLAAVAERRPSWWRRLLAALRGRGYAAGQRRARRNPVRTIRWILVILALLVTVTMVIEPSRVWFNAGIEKVRDRIADPAPVTPVASAASTQARGHGAGLVHDGISNSYWTPARAGAGAGQWVEVELAEPVRLLYVLITPGIATEQKRFLTQARPKVVEVALTGDDGEVTTHTLTVRDQPGAQEFPLVRSGVTKLRVTVLSAYGAQPGRRLAIAELELRVR